MALDFGMLYTDSKLKNTPQNETQNYCFNTCSAFDEALFTFQIPVAMLVTPAL